MAPGYRIYFARQGQDVVLLLGGGIKDSQSRDIRVAVQLARDL
jgi:putative addiction module killer protein